MNLSNAWRAVRDAASTVGHRLTEVDDPRGRVAFHCSKCDETFTASITDVWTADEAVKKVWSVIPDPCRGRPLYRRIPGTPWFEYR